MTDDAFQEVLRGGGDMGALMRATDWPATSLGPISTWPQSLLSALSICLGSRFPIAIYWGPELALLYNDAWSPIPGTKHPWALGRPAREVWPEIWDSIGPLFDQVMSTGEATYSEDSLLLMHRHGYTEECYFNFTFSPIRSESGRVGGVFNAVIETTFRVISERRAGLIRDLPPATTGARSPEEVCVRAAAKLETARHDVPFSALYLLDADHTARLVASSGLPAGHALLVPAIDLEAPSVWPLAAVRSSGLVETVAGLRDHLRPIAGAPWPESVDTALVAPLRAGPTGRTRGFVVLGASPRRAIDADYVDFAERVTSQIATVLAMVDAYEEERRRAERLAELDRAKTAFFSNVSHEFRTPLTLMLGPLEDARASEGGLRGADLETTHRNALRLLKLVNALLDFSRLEAGGLLPRVEPTDLAALTADLASTFRTVVERAGVRLVIDAPPIGAVPVDRGMWENIVLNLISNAFKFTREGEIRIALRRAGDHVELSVADTGTGIPAHELPHVFRRFHRVENPRARTHEGSGIGLALVQELAQLHDGTVRVESQVDHGTEFTVSIPVGVGRVVDVATEPTSVSVARAYVDEAQRWVPSEAQGEPGQILIADDNADMREYLHRMLSEQWSVATVSDGQTAVETAARDLPEVVITDVMMPGLGGFDVLAALRADERTRHVRVIMLSARAGEEARVEGLAAGADDYLTKPFSARELIARVRTQLALARARRQAETELGELYGLLMQVPAEIIVRRGPDHVCAFQNTLALAASDQRGKPLRESPHLARDQVTIYDRVRATGEIHVERDIGVTRAWNGEPEHMRYWDVTYAPLRLSDGAIDGVISIAFEVTDAVVARAEAANAQQRLHAALAASAIGTYFWNIATDVVEHDEGVKRLFRFDADMGDAIDDYTARVHPDDRERWLAGLATCVNDGLDFHQEYRVVWPDGSVHWVLDKGRMAREALGVPGYVVGAIVDITEQRRLADEALAASRAKDEFLAMLGHELRNPLAPITTAIELIRLRGDPMTKELTMIERQVRHLSRLVDDLLDISRITRGSVDLQRETISLETVLTRAIEIASPLIEQKRHRLSVEIDPSLRTVGDPVRLAQIYSNILTNAARYTHTGGNIRVTATREGDRGVVRVADNGIGIEPAFIERIFDLFVQGGRGVARSEGGLGLGLALVHSLVQLHGGCVWVTSAGAGKGSEFTVELPLAPDAPVEMRAPAVSPSFAKRRRVLLVDDNVDAVDLISDLLRGMGHEVAVAHDGAAALKLVEAFDPEVAVLDIGLPVMDGYELARRVRQRPNHCRLIALTGYGQPSDVERARAAGFDAHMIKPVDVNALCRVLAG